MGLTLGEARGKLATRMARKLRVQYPGAIYHVMNRGDRREAIYINDKDRQLFLETLGEATEKAQLERAGSGGPPQGGPAQIEDRGEIATGDDHDAGVDCPATLHGCRGPCLVLALSEIEKRSGSWRWQ